MVSEPEVEAASSVQVGENSVDGVATCTSSQILEPVHTKSSPIMSEVQARSKVRAQHDTDAKLEQRL